MASLSFIPSGDFRTSYAADTTIFPTSTSRNFAIAGVVVAVVNGVSSGLSAYGIKVFPAAILGGLDSIGGAVLGGIIIGLLENIAQFVDSQYLHWGNLYEIAPFYVMIIILMIKPYGLFGTEDIERI